jgi:hypothetical protein
MSEYEKPIWHEKGYWTYPLGYASPKCKGCGHNYFERKLLPIANNEYPDGGLCKWCIEEGIQK